MENTTRNQAIVDQMASNFAVRIAQLESEKAMLQVDIQILQQKVETFENKDKDVEE